MRPRWDRIMFRGAPWFGDAITLAFIISCGSPGLGDVISSRSDDPTRIRCPQRDQMTPMRSDDPKGVKYPSQCTGNILIRPQRGRTKSLKCAQ